MPKRRFVVAAVLVIFVAACGPPPPGSKPPGGCRALTSGDVFGGVTLAKGCYTGAADLVVTGGTLTLAPGVVLSMARGAGLRIDAGAALKAVGTQAEPIVLRGEEMNPGTWKGVAFFDSASPDNDLVYAVVEYGGGVPWTGAANSAANLAVFGTSKVRMDHGTLATGESAGFLASGELDLTNTVSTDNPFPGWVTPAGVTHLDPSNRLTGNTLDELRIDGATTLTRSTTWDDLGVPYVVLHGLTVDGGATLTVGPGVMVEAGAGTTLRIGPTGTLRVAGTAAKPSGILGQHDAPGYWNGLLVQSTGNTLHHAVIADGGADPNLDRAEIRLDGALTMDQVTVAYSSGFGISLRTGAHLTGCPTVTFTGNAQGDVEGDRVHLSDCP